MAIETLKQQIASSLNLSEVLDLVAAGVVKGMGPGIKGSAITLLDKKKNLLKVVAHQGLSRGYLEKGPIDSSRSLGEMILKGEYIWIRDVAQDPRVQYPEEAQREGIASILSVPMTVRNEVIGALRVYTGEPRDFDPDEIRCLHRFAEQAALAIENARTFEDIKNKYENLRTELVDFFDDGWT
jgi:GAF domain-containing protein